MTVVGVRRVLRRRGLAGTARQLVSRVRQRVWISESHIWFELAPDDAPRSRSLSPEMVAFSATRHQLDLLEHLPTEVKASEAERRLDNGAELWLVTMLGEPLFCCWTFRETAPVAAAPGGALAIPPGIVIVEDVATAEAYRGRGIAPSALAVVAGRQDRRVTKLVLAKVDHRNRASRKAFRKAGFRPVARMHRQERGPFTAVQVEGDVEDRAVRMLRQRLARRTGERPRG